MTNKVDMASFHAAIDQRRQSANLSWRQLAKALEISPSTLSRMAQGHKPDVDSFATIVDWLGVPAEQFFRGSSPTQQAEPDTLALVSSHLRANKRLTNENAKALEQIIRTAYDALKEPSDDGVP